MSYRSSRYGDRRSPLLPFLLLLLGALAVGFVAGVLLSGDGPAGASPTPSLGPSGIGGGAAPTLTPDPGSAEGTPAPPPSPVVAPPTDVLPPGAVAQVAVEVLRIRESPSTDARLLDQLPRGQLVLIDPGLPPGGPVTGGGFTWYPVRRIAELSELPALPAALPGEGAVGWAAAGDAETAYLALLAPRCAARPVALATLEAMTPWERLACFGSEALTFEGTVGCGGCGGAEAGTFEPAWLASSLAELPISVDPNARIGPFGLRFRPEGPAMPPNASIVTVTGHFDDPAAAGCVIAPGDPPGPIDSRTAILACRERFVVDTIQVTGTDPDFPTA